ncbi:hypothetical protein D3C85_1479830 [compost metagenome]
MVRAVQYTCNAIRVSVSRLKKVVKSFSQPFGSNAFRRFSSSIMAQYAVPDSPDGASSVREWFKRRSLHTGTRQLKPLEGSG